MEKKSKKRGSSPKTQPSAPFEQSLGPLMKAIDDAVEPMVDERERRQVRQAVGQAVHDALVHLAKTQRPASVKAFSADALNSGVDALKRVQDLGFVEFTTGLINGTFDALINVTIKQMDAYAELVADLAKTLAQFQSENIDEGHVTARLAQRYPDGEGGTSVRPGYTFADTPEDTSKGIKGKTGLEKLDEVGKALAEETKNNKTKFNWSSRPPTTPPTTPPPAQFTKDEVNSARAAIAEMLAVSMIEHLRAMAREGMARIVITNGELLSKLTFKVNTTDALAVQKSNLDESSLSAGISGHFGSKAWGVQFGASYSQVHVSTVNESSFDAVTMSAEIIGMVRLQFKTETFPSVVVDTPVS